MGEGDTEMALLRGVGRHMPSFALWETLRAAKMAEITETPETAAISEMEGIPEMAKVAEKGEVADGAEVDEKGEVAEMEEVAEKAEVPEKAGVAERAEVAEKAAVGVGLGVDRWRKSEERKALLQGLVTAEDVQTLEGVDWTGFDPRLFKVEAGT